MADVTQGVNYEFTAEDRTGPATDSAVANLNRQEQAADKANDAAKKAADGSRGLFAAAAKALSGNFKDLAAEIGRVVAKLGGLSIGPKMMGAIGFAAAGAVSAVKGIAAAFKAAADEQREAARIDLQSRIESIGDEAKDFADGMARARREAEGMRKVFDDELQSVREMTKAQNELVKQQELAMARTPEEREAIELRHTRNNALNDAYLDEEARRRDIMDAQDEIKRLEDELAQAESDEKRYRAAGRGSAERLLASQNRGFFATSWGNLTDRLGLTDNAGDEERDSRTAEETAKLAVEAAQRAGDVREKIELARHRLEMANRREELALVQDAATDQMNLNEDFRREEEAVEKEREKAEEDRVRRIEELETESAGRIRDERMRNVAEVSAAQQKAEAEAAAARDRLSAARAAVQQAWGWYRDKDSLKAQLDEEKANAGAERQFEKDFAKLTFRRDWRTAKNLSVDEEAVRRVGVAREEEDAAKKAAAETAANTAKAAEELERIREAIAEE